MLKEIGKQLRIACTLIFLLTLLTGIIYPLCVNLIAQVLFPWQANGSLIKVQQKTIGSQLIGQAFTGDQYFWSRPSATTPYPYNAENSSGSNLGPSNPDFLATVKNRVSQLSASNLSASKLFPVDLVTGSASGLDPDISPRAAFFQVPRIAKARATSTEKINALIMNTLQGRYLGILGEPRVNVLALNIGLDNLNSTDAKSGQTP